MLWTVGEILLDNCGVSVSKMKGLQPTGTGQLYHFVE